MGRYRTGGDDIYVLLSQMEKRIKDLESVNRIGYTSMEVGNFISTSGQLDWYVAGRLVLSAGPNAVDGTEGVAIYRRDGTRALTVKEFGETQALAIWDRTGNIVVSDDTTSGIGLATPYIPYDWRPSSEAVTAPHSTTSASFENLQTIYGIRQNPKIRILLLIQSDADTTGEVQLWNHNWGRVVAGPQSVGTNTNQTYELIGDLRFEATQKEPFVFDLQAKRTAGTGSVRVAIQFAYGVQS